MLSESRPAASSHLVIVQGREAILAHSHLLRELAYRCGQPGAMHWLEYFLNPSATQRKPPVLVLQLYRPTPSARVTQDNLRAAALFFEYRVLGWRTRAFSTDDTVGFRTVIARPEDRAQIAAEASQALIDRGAHVVLVTYETAQQPRAQTETPRFSGLLAGSRERTVRRFLSLGPTYEETLQRLGRLTRRNLRYYRRHLEQRNPCEFVADARAELTLERLQAINLKSINPVCEEELQRRWSAASLLHGSFLVGLRTLDGQWLSLAGGWRQAGTTVLHWQMNAAGYERDSMSTAMRAFFLEHEVQRGTERLLMYGGTPHSIRHSFEQETIADLLVCRPSVRSKLLRLLARTVASPSGLTGRSNFLARTLLELPVSASGTPDGGMPQPGSRTFTQANGMRL